MYEKRLLSCAALSEDKGASSLFLNYDVRVSSVFLLTQSRQNFTIYVLKQGRRYFAENFVYNYCQK